MKLSDFPGKNKLVHLSFDGNLGGFIHPRKPAGYTDGGKFKEPPIPRICVSDNIAGALQAIYPNISSMFEKKNLPHVDFYLYTCKTLRRDDLLKTYHLSKLKLVHDAHITGEHWFMEPVRLVKEPRKVRLYNPNHLPNKPYHPFGDEAKKMESAGPDLTKARVELISF